MEESWELKIILFHEYIDFKVNLISKKNHFVQTILTFRLSLSLCLDYGDTMPITEFDELRSRACLTMRRQLIWSGLAKGTHQKSNERQAYMEFHEN